jgi:APA family basic amino acid/polyamine antiporter
MYRRSRHALTSIVVVAMIGTGLFTTSGFVLADLGTPDRVILIWILGGLIARRVVESGGECVCLARNVHPLT